MQTCFVAVMAIFAAQVDLTIASKHADTLTTTIASLAEENQTENARSLAFPPCFDAPQCYFPSCTNPSSCYQPCVPCVTETPTETPTASYTPYLTSKGQQCAAGRAIDTDVECKEAIQGATWKGDKPSRNRQYGCYYIERADEVFFNPTPVTKRRVWKHSKGVCKGGDFEATLAYKEATKKGRNCANGEVVINVGGCKLAANELGKSFKKSVTSKTRPAGCYFKGGKAWFNTITTAYAKGRYGKFTGVCKAGN